MATSNKKKYKDKYGVEYDREYGIIPHAGVASGFEEYVTLPRAKSTKTVKKKAAPKKTAKKK